MTRRSAIILPQIKEEFVGHPRDYDFKAQAGNFKILSDLLADFDLELEHVHARVYDCTKRFRGGTPQVFKAWIGDKTDRLSSGTSMKVSHPTRATISSLLAGKRFFFHYFLRDEFMRAMLMAAAKSNMPAQTRKRKIVI